MPRGCTLYRGLLVSLVVLPLMLAAGQAAHPSTIHAARWAAATPRPTPTAGPAGNTTSPPTGTSTGDTSLLDDETSLLTSRLPDLSTVVPLSTLPAVKGSVADLATRVIGLLGTVGRSSLPGSLKNTLIGRLQNLNLQLGPALDLQDRIAGLRSQENLLVQARVDAQAGIDKLDAQVQVNLDKLRVAVETTVSADVVASVGGLTVTVSGGADVIQAQLGAKVNRLLVNVITDLDVLHIATLHAVAHVDTARLNVNLFAQVRKLRLDLNLLLNTLKVSAHADVAAAIAAEASLTASLAAEIDGLRADLAVDVDTKLGGLDALLRSLVGALNGELAAASRTLQGIQAQVH